METRNMETRNMDSRNMDSRIDISWPRNHLESKLNMYERQIDQLFEFAYKDQDDIKTLFSIKDDLEKYVVDKKTNDSNINEIKICIQNYYHLELENKRRMLDHEFYQFQLFIFLIFIICYLIYLKFA
jgi:hypothetical protein